MISIGPNVAGSRDAGWISSYARRIQSDFQVLNAVLPKKQDALRALVFVSPVPVNAYPTSGRTMRAGPLVVALLILGLLSGYGVSWTTRNNTQPGSSPAGFHTLESFRSSDGPNAALNPARSLLDWRTSLRPANHLDAPSTFGVYCVVVAVDVNQGYCFLRLKVFSQVL